MIGKGYKIFPALQVGLANLDRGAAIAKQYLRLPLLPLDAAIKECRALPDRLVDTGAAHFAMFRGWSAMVGRAITIYDLAAGVQGESKPLLSMVEICLVGRDSLDIATAAQDVFTSACGSIGVAVVDGKATIAIPGLFSEEKVPELLRELHRRIETVAGSA